MSRGMVRVLMQVSGSLHDIGELIRLLVRKKRADLRAWYGARWKRTNIGFLTVGVRR